MSLLPSAEVLAALEAAARKHAIPIKLLEAIAFVESSFNPRAVSPAGAQGLMQLMPKIQQRYGVTDPFDPKQSADGGAALLANLAKPLAWNVDEMLAAYNWGVANLAQAKAAGRAWPKEVLTYVARVKSARQAYEGYANPVSGTRFHQLDAGIRNLARLNPQTPIVTAVLASWLPFYQQHELDVVSPVAALKPHWEGYRQAFDRAPITDTTTPAPFRLSPDLALVANELIDEGKKKARKIGDALDAFSAQLPAVGALVLLALFTRRRH